MLPLPISGNKSCPRVTQGGIWWCHRKGRGQRHGLTHEILLLKKGGWQSVLTATTTAATTTTATSPWFDPWAWNPNNNLRGKHL